MLDERRCRIADLKSANGTEVMAEGKWRRIEKAVVTVDHPVRLGGEYETTVRDLLRIGVSRRVATGRNAEILPPDAIATPQAGWNRSRLITSRRGK